MKKKQLITIVVMLFAVVALASGYAVVKNINENKEAEEETDSDESATIDMFEINGDDVAGISYTSDVGSADIVREGGAWIEKETNIPVNDDMVQSMIDAVSSVVAIRIISEDTDNLADFGLETPVLSYTITLNDGTRHDISIGNKLQTGIEGYYALLDSDKKVYSISANYFNPFYKTMADITAIEDDITVNMEHITKFALDKAGEFSFAASYVGDGIEGSSYYTWQIDEPYDNVMADTDRLNEITGGLGDLKFERCVDYGAEDFSKYGLDEPAISIMVEYYDVIGESDSEEDSGEEQNEDTGGSDRDSAPTPVPENMRAYSSITLNVGDSYTEDDESYYYVSPEGSSNVYIMKASDIDNISDFTPYSLADHCIYTILADQLTGYEVEYEGGKVVVERKKESDSDDAEDVYYVNDKKVESEGILTLFSAAYLLTMSGEADDGIAEPDESPVLKITYHTNAGEDDVVKYIPYDGNNFYQVDKNGMNYFLTDKRGIDDLISRYKAYMKENIDK